MTDGPSQYPVNTLVEMAAIPPERLGAFLAELPTMLAMVKASAVVGMKVGPMIWRDDGLTHADVTFRAVDGTVTRTERMQF